MFLLLIFLGQTGYHLFFSVQQHEIRESVKRQLLESVPQAQLEIIDAGLNKADIQWEEEGREFYLHGQLYDVAYTKKINGKTLIYCLNDTREENLLKGLSNVVSDNTDKPGSDHPSQHPVKFQSPEFILSNERLTVDEASPEQKYYYPCDKSTSVFADIITPPPDLKSKNQTGLL